MANNYLWQQWKNKDVLRFAVVGKKAFTLAADNMQACRTSRIKLLAQGLCYDYSRWGRKKKILSDNCKI